MNTKPITLVSVRLPPELVEKIDERARDECRSRNSQIQHALQSVFGRATSQRAGALHLETGESAANG